MYYQKKNKIIPVLILIISMVTACSEPSVSNSTQQNENPANTISTPHLTQQPAIVTPVPSEKLVEPSQHGTTEYAEYIFYKAVNDSISADESKAQEAVSFLKTNTANYFSTQEKMEQTMYYGKLLGYIYRETGNVYEKTGRQAYRTVEYVYRGYEQINDEATLKNLNKLQSMVAELPDIK